MILICNVDELILHYYLNIQQVLKTMMTRNLNATKISFQVCHLLIKSIMQIKCSTFKALKLVFKNSQN